MGFQDFDHNLTAIKAEIPALPDLVNIMDDMSNY
jgi:hypothetical protein